MTITKSLELELILDGDTARVEFYQPDSGDYHALYLEGCDVTERDEFIQSIGEEVFGWFELMSESEDEDEDEEDDEDEEQEGTN